jgi:hypothetical protein
MLKQGHMIQRELWILQSGLLVKPPEAQHSAETQKEWRTHV